MKLNYFLFFVMILNVQVLLPAAVDLVSFHELSELMLNKIKYEFETTGESYTIRDFSLYISMLRSFDKSHRLFLSQQTQNVVVDFFKRNKCEFTFLQAVTMCDQVCNNFAIRDDCLFFIKSELGIIHFLNNPKRIQAEKLDRQINPVHLQFVASL